ncbi:phosphonate transport system permease protein [Desulfotomaculum arcticum]|uniref:Phosphonate transport system permease protein n=1 Tax=Desulfotruncus arcticus DSM 17038 TaxID=1121424 RepID=A0A1I2V0V0_9FIRM|nr:ABC transporter permease subunit [Desulfotruncus arcticus]SFG82954.1 phosphonate transport system permease protein [Desulfotomaculum arcticum] [Desulfotruncus arcticus DSM 17038]
MQIEESIKGWGQLSNDETGDSINLAIKPLNRASLAMRTVLLALAVLTIYALSTIDYQSIDIPRAVADTFSNFKLMFLQPSSHRLSWWDAFYGVLITMGLAFLTTLFGGFIALFLGLLSAQNLAPKQVAGMIKGFVAFIRAVPTILWVLIFAVAAGLGSEAAVIGMTFHSVSYLTKAYSESFEDLDRSVIEALMASGANWWQIIFQAVIPSSVTYLLSWTFLRFEINFGNAVAMGAAAGAAGIGFDLFMASGFYFDLREVGLVTYLILAFAIILEIISVNMKGQFEKRI